MESNDRSTGNVPRKQKMKEKNMLSARHQFDSVKSVSFFNCYKFFIPYRIYWYRPTFGENCFVFKPQLPPKRLLLDRVCSCTLLHNEQHLQNCLELTKNTEKRVWMVLFMVKGDAMVWVRMPQFLFALKDEKMRK